MTASAQPRLDRREYLILNPTRCHERSDRAFTRTLLFRRKLYAQVSKLSTQLVHR